MQANLSNSYRFVPILDFFDYEEVAIPPSASALAVEYKSRFEKLISNLDLSSSSVLYDQLLYISKITGYPNTPNSKVIYPITISEDDYELTDYLLSITVSKSSVPAYSRAVILTWLWLLDRTKYRLIDIL